MKNKLFSTLYPMCYRVLMAAVLSGIVISSIGGLLGIEQVTAGNLFMTVWVLLLLAGLNYGKANTRLVSGIVLVLSVVVLLPLVVTGQINGFFDTYIHWLMRSTEYEEEWVIGYELLQNVWMVIGCYVFQIILEKRQIFEAITAGLLGTGMLICMLQNVKINRIGVACIIFYAVIICVQQIREHWYKEKAHDVREYIICLVPFLAVYILALCYVPISEKPYDWQFVKDVYGNISENATRWWENVRRNEQEDFGLASMGFSEEREFMPGFVRSDKYIMSLKGYADKVGNSYLRGKSYDTFTGKAWEKTVIEDKEEYPFDTLELLYAVNRYDEEGMEEYLHIADLHVYYEYFNTGYLFSPNKVISVGNTDYIWQGGDLVFGKQRGYGTEYDVHYYQMNVEAPEFETLLETEYSDDELVWEKVLTMKPLLTSKSYSMEDLDRYRNTMRDNYFKEVKISEGVREYLNEVTSDCKTTYQKLKAIEEELAGYTYTSMPGEIPERVDSQEAFLDYFLLESKQGFCSHFATAFVLMARAEGLPARYVEGFCVPMANQKEIEVSSYMAHAWPEVYWEGVGWIPFEPTPGYGDYRYSGWQPIDFTQKSRNKEQVFEVQEEVEDVQQEALEPEEQEDKRVGIVLQGVLFILLICLLVMVVEKILQRYRYKQMDTEGKFLAEVGCNLWLFAKLGYQRNDAETLSELQDRIRTAVPQWMEGKEKFICLEAYEEYLYRNTEVTENLLQETKTEREILLNSIRQQKKYTYYVIRFGMFFRMGM